MPESIQFLLDNLSEAAVQERQRNILYSNAAARGYLPELTAGAPLPDYLDFSMTSPRGIGTFSAGGISYDVQISCSGEERLLLFHPAPKPVLSGGQLEGALRQLRAFLGEFAAEMGPAAGPDAAPFTPQSRDGFLKSYCRTLRLVNNLDYLCQAGSPQGVRFRPASLDLAMMCRRMVQEAAPLLGQAGVVLRYEPECGSLLIPGDSELLGRMLMELIANAARAVGEGAVVLRLRQQNQQALLTLSDSGGVLTRQQMDAVLQQNSGALPQPGQGAGLGLPIARHIVELHRGELLMGLGSAPLSILISLPTGPLSSHVQVRAPNPDRYGGLSPILVELSDVLPARLFRTEGLD